MSDQITIGYDYSLLIDLGIKIKLSMPSDSHLIVVGGSGSGKSTSVKFWLSKLCPDNVVYIADFKKSREFSGITSHYAEENYSYELIMNFYEEFMNTPEGGDGRQKILFIDEIAGMLSCLSMNKDTKDKAEKIRTVMATILMMGRSRRCFLWLSMQRYSATIFPAASGAADNFHVIVGLGRLSVDGRRSLFAGEHLEGEEEMNFRRGTGLVLIDGQPLRAIVLPYIDKEKLHIRFRD